MTPTTNETANAWRQRCRDNIEKKKAAAGRIPRNATQLYITFLINTTASRAGESVMVYKHDGAWIYTSKTGSRWRLTAAMLRNDEVIRINGTEEPTPEPLPEEVTTNAQEAPTSAGTNADTETPTQGETAPQDATSEATTGPETSTATQDTTGSDTRPPRATEDATTGHAANTSTPATAAGDTSTPENQEPEPLPELSRAALPPNHRTPATLARMPQDARNEHRPNKYTRHTPKAHHGPHRKPDGIPAAAAKTGEK